MGRRREGGGGGVAFECQDARVASDDDCHAE